MTFSLIRGDATSIPLADDSVDLVVTSPPYFALRSYTDGGEHYDGQIGSEATPVMALPVLETNRTHPNARAAAGAARRTPRK